MTSWTTIPPWLYENDLPDDQLQAVYVRGAEKKHAAAVAERERLEQEVADLRAFKRREVTAEMWSALVDELAERTEWLEEAYRAEERALAFREETRRALAAYRAQRRLARG